MYDLESKYQSQTRANVFGLRATDVQATSTGAPVVLTQARDFTARFTTTDPTQTRPTASEGYSTFSTSGESIYYTVFEQAGLSTEEVPVEVVLSPNEATMEEVPGVPFLDGWVEFEPFVDDRVVPLTVTSTEVNWSREIHLRLQTSRGNFAPGRVAWEREVAPDGTVHFLLFAGTYGKRRIDDWWYLKVTNDGTVGTPVRLQRASELGGPYRHLALDSSGLPFAMWVHRKNLIVEDLSTL